MPVGPCSLNNLHTPLLYAAECADLDLDDVSIIRWLCCAVKQKLQAAFGLNALFDN